MAKLTIPPETAARAYDQQRALLWRKYHPIPITEVFYSLQNTVIFYGLFFGCISIIQFAPKYLTVFAIFTINIEIVVYTLFFIIAAVESLYRGLLLRDPENRIPKHSQNQLKSEYERKRLNIVGLFSNTLGVIDRKKIVYRDVLVSSLQRKRDFANNVIKWFTSGTWVTLILSFINKKDLQVWLNIQFNAHTSIFEMSVAFVVLILVAALVYRQQADGILDIARRPTPFQVSPK